MLQDTQGHVWAMTAAGYLTKWIRHLVADVGTIGGTATMSGIGKDLNGVVYVSSWHGGVYKMINDTPVFFADAEALRAGSCSGRTAISGSRLRRQRHLRTVRQYTSSGHYSAGSTPTTAACLIISSRG
jgi:hypothetical protein